MHCWNVRIVSCYYIMVRPAYWKHTPANEKRLPCPLSMPRVQPRDIGVFLKKLCEDGHCAGCKKRVIAEEQKVLPNWVKHWRLLSTRQSINTATIPRVYSRAQVTLPCFYDKNVGGCCETVLIWGVSVCSRPTILKWGWSSCHHSDDELTKEQAVFNRSWWCYRVHSSLVMN